MSNTVVTTTTSSTEYTHNILDNKSYIKYREQSCLHDTCPECGGTGYKRNGGICVHNLSCPCPKCSPTC